VEREDDREPLLGGGGREVRGQVDPVVHVDGVGAFLAEQRPP
jgi:hypothetical protein